MKPIAPESMVTVGMFCTMGGGFLFSIGLTIVLTYLCQK